MRQRPLEEKGPHIGMEGSALYVGKSQGMIGARKGIVTLWGGSCWCDEKKHPKGETLILDTGREGVTLEDLGKDF